MEEKQDRSKTEAELSLRRYKIALILLKYIPFIIGIVHLIVAICSCFGVELFWLPLLFCASPVLLGVLAYLSYTFKSCIWHRLPIYYSIIVYGISKLDYYLPITLTNSWMLFVYLLVTIIFILLGMYYKNRYNVKRKVSKGRTS